VLVQVVYSSLPADKYTGMLVPNGYIPTAIFAIFIRAGLDKTSLNWNITTKELADQLFTVFGNFFLRTRSP